MMGGVSMAWGHDDWKLLCAASFGVDITEMYSPARITQPCDKFKLIPGSAIDLQTGWGLNLAAHRLEALRRIKEEAPLLPMCSTLHTFQCVARVKPCTTHSQRRVDGQVQCTAGGGKDACAILHLSVQDPAGCWT